MVQNIVSSTIFLICSYLLSCLVSGNAAAVSQAQPYKLAINKSEPCILTVGWGEWPPYQMQKQGNIPQGIQIDLINSIAQEVGCKLTFLLQTFSQNQKTIRDGTIDLTLDTTITEEREKYAHFSIPYRNEVMVLYVRPHYVTACQIKKAAVFIKEGFRLGVTTGNIYGESISAIQADETLNPSLIYRDRNSQHFELFRQNAIDGFIEDPTVMGYKLREDSSIGPLIPCKIAVNSSPVSLMFSKKTVSIELVRKFNAAIEKIKNTPEYKNLWQW